MSCSTRCSQEKFNEAHLCVIRVSCEFRRSASVPLRPQGFLNITTSNKQHSEDQVAIKRRTGPGQVQKSINLEFSYKTNPKL